MNREYVWVKDMNELPYTRLTRLEKLKLKLDYKWKDSRKNENLKSY